MHARMLHEMKYLVEGNEMITVRAMGSVRALRGES